MFHAKLGKCPSSDVSMEEQKRDISLSLTEDVEENVQLPVENRKSEERTEGSQESDTKPASMSGSFLELNDAADEFFDFPDEPEYDKQEDTWPSDSQLQSQVDHCYYPQIFLSFLENETFFFIRRLYKYFVLS